MEIVNPGPEDYHIHSLNFSDGCSTVDEILKHAKTIGLKRIAITDYSDAVLSANGMHPQLSRGSFMNYYYKKSLLGTNPLPKGRGISVPHT